MIYSRLTHEGRSSAKALKSLGSPCQTRREDLPAGKKKLPLDKQSSSGENKIIA